MSIAKVRRRNASQIHNIAVLPTQSHTRISRFNKYKTPRTFDAITKATNGKSSKGTSHAKVRSILLDSRSDRGCFSRYVSFLHRLAGRCLKSSLILSEGEFAPAPSGLRARMTFAPQSLVCQEPRLSRLYFPLLARKKRSQSSLRSRFETLWKAH